MDTLKPELKVTVFSDYICLFRECGGAVKVIACIEGPVVIQKVLNHLRVKAGTDEPPPLPESWALPRGLFA